MKGDWLTDDDVIDGFEWRGGCHGVTTGILIWSKPFICVDKYGKEVVHRYCPSINHSIFIYVVMSYHTCS